MWMKHDETKLGLGKWNPRPQAETDRPIAEGPRKTISTFDLHEEFVFAEAPRKQNKLTNHPRKLKLWSRKQRRRSRWRQVGLAEDDIGFSPLRTLMSWSARTWGANDVTKESSKPGLLCNEFEFKQFVCNTLFNFFGSIPSMSISGLIFWTHVPPFGSRLKKAYSRRRHDYRSTWQQIDKNNIGQGWIDL